MTPRKLQALRNLAERPGTPQEGEVARRMLAKAEGKIRQPSETETKQYGEPAPDPFMAAAMKDVERKIMEAMLAQMQIPLADLQREFTQFEFTQFGFNRTYAKFNEFRRRK